MLIIGHRGDRQNFEDNTLEGIQSAFERGADGVEIDVFYNPEKEVYLFHRYIHDLNKDYPKLEDVIVKYKDKGKLQIEIKPPEVEAVIKVVDLIKKYKVKNYEITSSVLPLLKYAREVLPEAQIGMIAKSYLIEEWMTQEFGDYLMLNYLKLTGANSIWLTDPRDFWTKARVKRFHNKGFKVNHHLFDDSEEEYKRLLSLNIDSCTVDNLGVLKWRK